MCYAIPGKVTAFKENKVVVDYFGEERFAYNNEYIKVKVGDYIYAQGGFVIDTVPQKEAIEILEFWKETFFNLRDIDLRLSGLSGKENVLKKTALILDKALEGKNLKFEELLYLFSLKEESELNYLYKVANFIRQKYHKNACCVHGIIEFSNYCIRDCFYCGIRKSNLEIERFRLKEEEILKVVKEAVKNYGFKSLVLQSGEDPYYNVDKLSYLIKKILKENAVLLFISVNEVGEEGLRKFYRAGARGALIRFETGDPFLYKKFHPNDNLEERLAEIEIAKKIGFLVLTGGLIGLPGQNEESILKDILLAKKLEPEMYSFGPFLSHPQTPLKEKESPTASLVLRCLAILRIVDPYGKILVTSALETLKADGGREKGFMAGANSVMLNLTPEKYRLLYQIYPDRIYERVPIDLQIKQVIDDLQKLGRAPTDLGIRTVFPQTGGTGGDGA